MAIVIPTSVSGQEAPPTAASLTNGHPPPVHPPLMPGSSSPPMTTHSEMESENCMNPEVRVCAGIQALLFSVCVTLSKVLNLSVPQFSQTENNNNSTSLVVLLRSVPLKLPVHTNHPGVLFKRRFVLSGSEGGPGFPHSQQARHMLLLLGSHFESQRSTLPWKSWRGAHRGSRVCGGEQASSLGRDKSPLWEKGKGGVVRPLGSCGPLLQMQKPRPTQGG